jgi:predicted ArsR family transcriptional regulator
MSSRLVIIRGDEVTIDADYLAEKLGLSTNRLRAEMRRGIVYGLVERGVDNDAGRLRLTFRYRAHSWTVVVQPEGTLDEVAAPACEAER